MAKSDSARWFIDFGNCVIECSKAERTEYYRMYYRYFNSRKCKNGRDADMVSLNSVNEAVSYGMSVFAVHNEPTIDDIVICRMYAADHAPIMERIRYTNRAGPELPMQSETAVYRCICGFSDK